MSTIMLSIRPQYMDKILDGSKKYEVRTDRYPIVSEIIFYVTAPVGQVVAKAKVKGWMHGRVDAVFYSTEDQAGMTREAYMNYFKEKMWALAYELGKVVRFPVPMTLADFGLSSPPQCFVWIER
jgi:predicted transcriptional regulator